MSLAGLGDESQEVRKLLEFSKDAVTFSRDASVDPLSLCVSSVLQKGRAPCFHQIEGVRTSSRGLCQWIQSLLIFIFIVTIYYFIYVFSPQASKSRRHRQVEVDFTSYEARSAPTLGRSRITKPSLKARTSENLHISGNLPVTTKDKHFTPVPALCAIPGPDLDIDKLVCIRLTFSKL